jgi:hypothetical protein
LDVPNAHGQRRPVGDELRDAAAHDPGADHRRLANRARGAAAVGFTF